MGMVKLQHPLVVKIIDCNSSCLIEFSNGSICKDYFSIVMEYAKNEMLVNYIEFQGLP
jgi:hypothetical protein